ncbi:MAG: glycosyltransferase [Ferruginibacter sp.]
MMKTKEAFISVILPVFNGGEYLIRSVQSVLAQDLREFEFLIVDDCSSDGSPGYLRELNDPRVKVFFNQENRGLFYNLNFLIGKTHSPLIKLWSQDDIMYDGCLREFTAFHELHPSVGFSYSKYDIIDESDNLVTVVKADDTPEIVSTGMHAAISYFTGSIAGNIANVCICSSVLKLAGPFREDMKISADFDMWVRLAEKFPVGFLKKKVIKLRNHSGQLSRNPALYIYHLKEDIEVYRQLDNYCEPIIKNKYKPLQDIYKLQFYYTLMFKSFLKGKWHTGLNFYRLLNDYADFKVLTWNFVKYKIFRLKRPVFKLPPI